MGKDFCRLDQHSSNGSDVTAVTDVILSSLQTPSGDAKGSHGHTLPRRK